MPTEKDAFTPFNDQALPFFCSYFALLATLFVVVYMSSTENWPIFKAELARKATKRGISATMHLHHI